MIKVIPINIIFVLLLCFAAGIPNKAFSQSSDLELTPLIGYRADIEIQDQTTDESNDINASNSMGFLLNWPSGPNTQWELLYSLQQTDAGVSSLSRNVDLDIHYLHIGGIYLLEEEAGATPYLGFTLGMTHIDPSGFDSEDFFSFAFAGGLKFFPSEHIGIRLDARAYGTIITGSGSIFCSGGSCAARFRSDGIWQYEASLGLIVRF